MGILPQQERFNLEEKRIALQEAEMKAAQELRERQQAALER
jgi:hypothetical protein